MNLFILAIHVFVILGVVYLTLRKCNDPSLTPYGWLSAGGKIAAGIVLGLVYKYHYQTGDTFVFHQEALNLAEFAMKNPMGYVKYLVGLEHLPVDSMYERMPRVLFQAKLVSLIHLFTGGDYWISSFYFSLFSWLGMWTLACKLATNFPALKYQAMLACLFFPSVVFWGSGLTKESVAAGAMGFIISFFVPTISWRMKHVLWLLCMVVLLWNVKYYYVVPLAFSLILIFVWDILGKYRAGWIVKLAVLPVAGLVVFAIVSLLNPNFRWNYFPEMVYMNYSVFIEKSLPGTFVAYTSMCDQWICLLHNFPEAVFTALYRPFIWDARNLLQLLAAAENMLLLVLLVFFLTRIFLFRLCSDFVIHRLLGAIIFILLLAGFLGLAAPNFGTLQRYTVVLVPVYVFICTSEMPLFKSLMRRFG